MGKTKVIRLRAFLTREGQDVLDALYDGLQVLAENLGALTLPFPPPVVPPPRGRHLRVVK